jgi:hypothetical protein
LNPKFADKSSPVEFTFSSYRLGIKVYIEAKPTPMQHIVQFLINKNRPLNLEISEKLCEKFMLRNENDFGRLIENELIVANSTLIVSKKPEYLVKDVHSLRGHFVYVDENP